MSTGSLALPYLNSQISVENVSTDTTAARLVSAITRTYHMRASRTFCENTYKPKFRDARHRVFVGTRNRGLHGTTAPVRGSEDTIDTRDDISRGVH